MASTDNFSNVVICNSTLIGYSSQRCPFEGSFYIKTICDLLKKCKLYEFTNILRKTEIKNGFEYLNTNAAEQITEFETLNLRKQFFFFDKQLLHLKPEMEINIFCQNEDELKKRNRKGLCLFIININYEGEMKRDGAEKDVTRITEVFNALDYDVVYLRNLSSCELLQRLNREIANTRESDQSLFIFISTHSDIKSIWTVDNGHVLLSDINEEISDSKIPHLKHIPKFLIIQGCRGDLPLRPLTSMRDILVVLSRECYDSKFDFNTNTYYVTLCDKIRALNDTELFNVLRKVESLLCDEKRYSFRTDAIGLYKQIFLNNSSRFAFRDDCYEFKNNRRGICIVVNNFSLKNTAQINSSIRDMKIFCETFKSLSYTVIPKINLTKEDIFILFEKIKSRKDFDDFYCVILMIKCSSNGNEMNCILDKSGEAIPIDVIIEKCPQVKSQPKLIFIQAMEKVEKIKIMNAEEHITLNSSLCNWMNLGEQKLYQLKNVLEHNKSSIPKVADYLEEYVNDFHSDCEIDQYFFQQN